MRDIGDVVRDIRARDLTLVTPEEARQILNALHMAVETHYALAARMFQLELMMAQLAKADQLAEMLAELERLIKATGGDAVPLPPSLLETLTREGIVEHV